MIFNINYIKVELVIIMKGNYQSQIPNILAVEKAITLVGDHIDGPV